MHGRYRQMLGLLSGLAIVALIACSENPGRVHAKKNELTGAYQAELSNGAETLELKPDGSYRQSFSFRNESFQRTGSWSIEDHFVGGTDVILRNAAVSEEDDKAPLRFGSMSLNVHRRSGKLALARNEVADWYFERSDRSTR